MQAVTGGFFWLFAALAMVALAVSALVLVLARAAGAHADDGARGVGGVLQGVSGIARGLRAEKDTGLPAAWRLTGAQSLDMCVELGLGNGHKVDAAVLAGSAGLGV